MRTLKLSNKRTEWNKRGCVIINKFPPAHLRTTKVQGGGIAITQKLIIEAASLLDS